MTPDQVVELLSALVVVYLIFTSGGGDVDKTVQYRVFEIRGDGVETNEPGWYWVPWNGDPAGPFEMEQDADLDAVQTIEYVEDPGDEPGVPERIG